MLTVSHFHYIGEYNKKDDYGSWIQGVRRINFSRLGTMPEGNKGTEVPWVRVGATEVYLYQQNMLRDKGPWPSVRLGKEELEFARNFAIHINERLKLQYLGQATMVTEYVVEEFVSEQFKGLLQGVFEYCLRKKMPLDFISLVEWFFYLFFIFYFNDSWT